MLSPSASRNYTRLGVLASAGLVSFLLVSTFELSKPQTQPTGIDFLANQAYQVTFEAGRAASVGSNEAVSGGANRTSDGGYWDEEDDSDYWSVSSIREGYDPLRADSTPFTELAIKTCVLSPGLYDLCSPTSTAREDQTRGKWERIDRDVSKTVGIYYLYLYGRRLLPGSSSDVITDLRITDNDKPESSWVAVSESLRTGIWPRMAPLYLHYALTPQSEVLATRRASSNNSAGALEPITEIDVLYGGNETHALPGYTKLFPMVSGGPDDDRAIGTGYGKKKGNRVGHTIAYRKEIPHMPATPVLRFSPDGNFTILQVADLHFSVGPGECRDMDPLRAEECRRVGADVYSIEWLVAALDEIKPDLAVLSGDQLNGQETSWDARSTILKWAPIFYERGIPWTIVFGNHDEQSTDLKHEAQMSLMRKLPMFLGESGPSNVDGTGNYVRSIRAADTDTVLFNMYFLDSHADAKSKLPWGSPGYDYLKPSQINWFRGRSAQMKTFMRPYTPKTSSRRPSRPRPGKGTKSGSKSKARPSVDLTDLKTKKRQRIPLEGESDDDKSWDVNADAELTDLEEAMVEKGSDGFSPAVEPDDGSSVVVDPYDDASDPTATSLGQDDEYSSMSGETDDGTKDEDLEATSNYSSEAYHEDEANEEGLEPSDPLPVGPSRSNPMEAKPNAIVFFHIPLQQAYTAPIDVSPAGTRLVVGERLEGAGASKTDSGFFDQAILKQGELAAASDQAAVVDEFWDGEYSAPTTGRPEVKVIAHGHCHITSDCRRIKGVWECFGGGGTYSGYGNATFPRRFRVYQLSDYGERIETFQLLDTHERINNAILVGEGSLEQAQA
ncbi:hypothetical protein JCM10212_003378 [Sporobolomyces blumeae]